MQHRVYLDAIIIDSDPGVDWTLLQNQLNDVLTRYGTSTIVHFNTAELDETADDEG